MTSKPRTKVGTTRVTGKIAEWKGKFGWIQPDSPVNHPSAAMHKGQIYLSQMDVEAEISGIGAHVSFLLYADSSGLGASSCRPANAPSVVKTIVKTPTFAQKHSSPQAVATAAVAAAAARATGTKGGGPKATKAQRTRVSNAPISGQVKTWKGTFGWITPLEPVKHPLFRDQIYIHIGDVESDTPLTQGAQVVFFLYSDPQGLGAEQCQVVDEEGGAATQPQAPAAAGATSPGDTPASSLERERLTVVPTTGEVIEWKRTFGWIRPHDDMDHEMAGKRDGKIYVHKKDLVGGTELQPGQLVQFHVFADSSGLGAEECMPF